VLTPISISDPMEITKSSIPRKPCTNSGKI
jgi:hypothetical protein